MIIKMRKNAGAIIIVLAAVLVLAMVLPGLFQGSGGGATVSGYWKEIVAVVQGRKITRLEYEREYISQLQLRSQFGAIRYDQLDKLRSSVLDMVVDKELVLAAAKADRVVLTKEVINAEVAKQKESVSGGNADTWTEFLNNWAFTEATFKDYVEENTLYDNYIDMAVEYPEVTDAEIQTEFDRRKASNASLVLDDIKEEIVNTLEYERKRTATDEYVSKLREEAQTANKIEIKDDRVLAYRAFEAGEYDTSIERYKAALKNSDQDPYLWCSLAMAQAKKGVFEEASASIEKAMEIGEDFTIYLTRAEIKAMQKLDDEAYADVEAAIKLAGTNLGVLQTINYVLEDMKAAGTDTTKMNERFMQAVTEALKAQEEAAKEEAAAEEGTAAGTP